MKSESDQLSVSVILLASTVFPILSVKHHTLPQSTTKPETKGGKRQGFSTCDSLVQEQYPSQNPSPQQIPLTSP